VSILTIASVSKRLYIRLPLFTFRSVLILLSVFTFCPIFVCLILNLLLRLVHQFEFVRFCFDLFCFVLCSSLFCVNYKCSVNYKDTLK
jgi:hypothetical protein